MIEVDVIDLLPRRRPLSLLDVGCGPCEEGEALLGAGVELTGLDQDGETIQRARGRLGGARLIAADAAWWLARTHERFDVVLMRRPDLFMRPQNWRQVFSAVQRAVAEDGEVIVTTPGEGEARLVRKWLEEGFSEVELTRTDWREEGFIVSAREKREVDERPASEVQGLDVEAPGTPDGTMGGLAQSLAWEDDEPVLICDLRTGVCTTVPPEGRE